MKKLLPLHAMAENFGLVSKSLRPKLGRRSYCSGICINQSVNYFPMQILELFDYKWFVSYVVQMWYKEIHNNSE